MLRTISTPDQTSNRLASLCVLLAALFLSPLPHSIGQEPSDDDVAAEKPSSGIFGRLFQSSSKQQAPAPTPPPKPKVPATPTAGKPRSGLFVPLKSLTKVFRGSEEAEEVEMEMAEPPRGIIPPRTPREPFKNLPRVQERRERAQNDLQVESSPIPSPPSLQSNPDLQIEREPAPIVMLDGQQKPKTNRTTNLPSTTSKPKSNTAASSNDFAIESNSTSRRTAMDSIESPSSRSPSLSNLGNLAQPINTSQKRYDGSKALVDLGQASGSKSPITSSSKEAAQNLELDSHSGPSLTSISSQQAAKSTKSNPSSRHELATSAHTTPNSNSNNVAPLHRDMVLPGVRVSVNGPSAILVNEEAPYEVVIKNEGTEPLQGLLMRVAVPQHVSIGKVAATEGATQADNDQDGNAIVWELEHLPAGAAKSARLMLQTAKPEHFALGIEWTVMPQSAEMQIAVQQPQLTLALEGPSEVIFGKPQMYRVRIRNPGNADVKDVGIVLSAEPYGSNQSNIGDIAAGSERVVEVELTFQQSGTLPVVATASSASSKLQAQSAIDVNVKQSELVATWFGPHEFFQGSVADYELELTNTGTITAQNTECKVKLPAGTDVVSMPTGAVRSGDSIKWEVKKLDPQERTSFALRLMMTKLGDHQLVFTGECSSSAETKAEFTTNIDAIADLHLSVVDPVAPAPVGQAVTYEIILTNRGKKAATNVDVLAQFSEGIEPTRVDGHTGRIVPGQAIFNTIPSIGPGEKLVLKVIAQAGQAGIHRFRAEVKSQGGETDLLEEESTRYLATGIKAERR